MTCILWKTVVNDSYEYCQDPFSTLQLSLKFTHSNENFQIAAHRTCGVCDEFSKSVECKEEKVFDVGILLTSFASI